MQLTRVGELGRFIRDQRRTARLSLRKLSGMAGISNPYLSQIERGLRRPSAEILQAIAKALAISAETLYVKAGILEERTDAADPVTAILRDGSLSDKQKQVLVEIYQSFRHDAGPRQDDATTLKAVAISRSTPTARAQTRTPTRRAAAKKKPAKKKPIAKKRTAKKAARKRSARKAARKTTKTATKKSARTPARRTAKRTTTKRSAR